MSKAENKGKLLKIIVLSQKRLSRIESGYRNSHFITIMEIANTLNIPINVFYRRFKGKPEQYIYIRNK